MLRRPSPANPTLPKPSRRAHDLEGTWRKEGGPPTHGLFEFPLAFWPLSNLFQRRRFPRARPSSIDHAVWWYLAWRAGIDLNPIDVNTSTQTAWLETLVWPGQEKRVERLRAALTVAQAEPPRIVKGNLLTDLAPLVAEAPERATLVIFHTAVLAYVASKADRERFAKAMQRSRAVWISNEVPSVFPDIAKAARPHRLLLAINGSAVAWTAPHGESIDWFGA